MGRGWGRSGQQPLGARHHGTSASLEEKDKGKERETGEVSRGRVWPTAPRTAIYTGAILRRRVSGNAPEMLV